MVTKKRKKKPALSKQIFTEEVIRYRLSSFFLSKTRQRLKLSVEQFATIVGWSISYQYKLESGSVATIGSKTRRELEQAFCRIDPGAAMISYITPSAEFHYTVDPDKIYTARRAKGLWLEECAARCGWSLQYQQNLESGKVKTVTEDVAKKIEETLK